MFVPVYMHTNMYAHIHVDMSVYTYWLPVRNTMAHAACRASLQLRDDMLFYHDGNPRQQVFKKASSGLRVVWPQVMGAPIYKCQVDLAGFREDVRIAPEGQRTSRKPEVRLPSTQATFQKSMATRAGLPPGRIDMERNKIKEQTHWQETQEGTRRLPCPVEASASTHILVSHSSSSYSIMYFTVGRKLILVLLYGPTYTYIHIHIYMYICRHTNNHG